MAEDPEAGYDFGVLEIDIRNVLVHYRGQFFQEDVLFEELRLGQVATWDPEASTPLTLRANGNTAKAERLEKEIEAAKESAGDE